MIDRLVLLLLVGGCLLFGAILIMELAPAGAEDPVVAAGGAVRRGEPNNSAAEPETRGAGCRRPRPTAFQQHAAASSRRSQRSRRRLRSRRCEADRDRYDATPPHRDIRGQRRQTAEGRRRRRRKRLADREHHAARSLVERPERNQNLAAKARSKFSPAAWATADRPTRRASANPAGCRQAARACAGRGPSRRAAASRCPCRSSRRAAAGSAAAPAAVMSTLCDIPFGLSPLP